MNVKKTNRMRRARRTRMKIRELGVQRLCVYRTPRHIYAQIIDAAGARVLVSASTLDRDVRADLKNGGNVSAAQVVGKRLAERAIAAGIKQVAFDRSGYRYHGRVRALADAAREGGLQF